MLKGGKSKTEHLDGLNAYLRRLLGLLVPTAASRAVLQTTAVDSEPTVPVLAQRSVGRLIAGNRVILLVLMPVVLINVPRALRRLELGERSRTWPPKSSK